METEKCEDICQTRVLNNPSLIAKQVLHIAETSSDLSIVSLIEGMQLIYNNSPDPYKIILDKYKKGEGKGIRWVINIEEESVEIVNSFWTWVCR
jgi:hypothetical protein